ncbi:efflux RND transporter periplasmic adaptor subunit [Crateriforma conspicua]|uniref:CusB-like beta-barrel domain-containing protein n=1 Tax=Crateriforma conspicua TaxID=2527996 RepID=A0A5C5Y0T7_9PLAN|nr:efflux RND transporter periplasmic adaptor subunit [Crateriforma conspicua]TWT68261.1 hypothetical protein Pan14r_05050 [Crateriforma conspicua]
MKDDHDLQQDIQQMLKSESVVATAGQSVRTALANADEGITQLAHMLGQMESPVETEPAKKPAAGLQTPLDCVVCIAGAKNRRESAERVVQRLASEYSGCHVRIAFGQRSMTKLYDHRLGWLSPSNRLRQSMEPLFQEGIEKEQNQSHGRTLRIDGVWVINLSEIGGKRHCFLWIQPQAGTKTEPASSSLVWMGRSSRALATALWRQPRVAMPSSASVLGRRPVLAGFLAMLVVSLLAFWPVAYPIRCTAVIKPQGQRMIASPFEATLLKSHVLPGDRVQAGQCLLELDGRPLQLELESIAAESQRAEKAENVALASGDIAAAQQAALEQRQLSRRRDLLQDRLSRLQICSPMDAVVISGDLSQYVGAPLKMGQSLLEIAPPGDMRVEVQIPEFEIGMVTPEADTHIRFPALGGKSYDAGLGQIYPAAEIRDDQNVFLAHVTIPNDSDDLRPGMKGLARISGPTRPRIWSYVRGIWEKSLWWMGY